MKRWYCLVVLDPNDLRVFRWKPHAGGVASMITSLISRLDVFENGAVPAGRWPRTNAAILFRESVAMLQDAHRGAGSNNNVTYTHRPVV